MGSRLFYVKIAGSLIVLLALTVVLSFVDLGPVGTAVAMLISVAKGVLIVMFFMRLRDASPVMKLFAAAGLFWLGLLFALSLSDYLAR